MAMCAVVAEWAFHCSDRALCTDVYCILPYISAGFYSAPPVQYRFSLGGYSTVSQKGILINILVLTAEFPSLTYEAEYVIAASRITDWSL